MYHMSTFERKVFIVHLYCMCEYFQFENEASWLFIESLSQLSIHPPATPTTTNTRTSIYG